MSDPLSSAGNDDRETIVRLCTALERAETLLADSAKVMREWTGYDVWRPPHDRIVAFLATPTTGGAPATCGRECSKESCREACVLEPDHKGYCSCRDAGRPLNPPCTTCGGTRWINETCGDDFSATHSVTCPTCRPTLEPR